MIDLKKTTIGLELGSTRIKAVMIDGKFNILATGCFDWENEFLDGIWTYSLDLVKQGVQSCFSSLKKDFESKYEMKLTTVGAIGISGMMHGYLPFDKDWNALVPFRTWRNTITGQAAKELSELFAFNIPQRWSIAHLYQAILNGEEHVGKISHLATISSYIHYVLSGIDVIGIGDASGMFPIDSRICDYDQDYLDSFDNLINGLFEWKIRDILPKVLVAGENAGALTARGVEFLDVTGELMPGIPLAPCEGDAGTGMVTTNSVRIKTGNVSAGTSDFLMVVTGMRMPAYREIDMVTTPDGADVAMIHCNNCTSDIDAWISLFGEFCHMHGIKMSKKELFDSLYLKALEGAPDCGNLISCNYFSGEGVTDFDEGRPLFGRSASSDFNLANFMRCQLQSALATLKIGLDILVKENIKIEKLYGHGGYFKASGVGQLMLSAASKVPVSVMTTAGEGGPYGMAILALFATAREEGETLSEYLDNKVFAEANESTIMATEEDIEGFERFVTSYKRFLNVERAAIEAI